MSRIPNYRFAMAAPLPRRSTLTPSRRNEDGLGTETEAEAWESSRSASATEETSSDWKNLDRQVHSEAESPADDDVRRTTEVIREKFHTNREKHKAREAAHPQPMPAVEEEIEEAQLGATAALGVAATQEASSSPEILKVEDPELRGVPLDPAIAEATRKRFLLDTESCGDGTPKRMVRW